MATVKTHDLVKCNRINPTLPSVNNPGLDPYNGLIVRFDNDNRKSYTVKKNVQARFLDGAMAAGPVLNYPSGYDVRYSVTSIKFNGVEYLVAPANFTYGIGDAIWTSFPNYTIGNEYLYTANLANGVYVADSEVDLGFNMNNFYYFFRDLIQALAIPVKVSKSPYLWWSPEGFQRIQNIILEKHYDVNFEFTYTTTIIDVASVLEDASYEYRHVFNGETAASYLNGVLNTSPTEAAQYSELYSFYSYDYTYDTIDEIPVCPILDPFGASIRNDENCPTLEISCDCKSIKFSDTSNYLTNGLPGHDPELFTSRRIILIKPDGSTYVWGTSDVPGVNMVIPPHFNSSNIFSYNLTNTDVDGIYTVQICTYPDWSGEVLYDQFLQHIVRRDGKLWKITATNTNVDPISVDGLLYWEEYICSADCESTRYCSSEKIVVLCVSLLKCYKKLVAEAMCGIEANPCKPMCDNKKFMNAMKFRITMDAVSDAVCEGNWVDAKKHIDILKSICCCNG